MKHNIRKDFFHIQEIALSTITGLTKTNIHPTKSVLILPRDVQERCFTRKMSTCVSQ